jgi:hypothetical protein
VANALYDTGRNSFLTQSPALDWDTDTIKVTLGDAADYTVNLSTHQYMNTNTVPAAGKVATGTLAGKSGTAGVADANDLTFTSVSGDPSEWLIGWKDGGGGGTTASGTTDPLIFYIDTATGLPVTPNGGDITVTWDNGSSKIFKL